VSTVQVGASAAAAVTSAVAASVFGVAGTLIGAALGSIISTVAGALYAQSLKHAAERLWATREVVIQRIPGEVLATTPLRHLTGPTDLPGEQSLRAIGDESVEESVDVPMAGKTELLAGTDTPIGRGDTPVGGGGAPVGGEAPVGSGPTPRPWFRRPAVTLPAIALTGFAISLGVVTATEGATGNPLSGGSGTTSLGKVFGDSGSSVKPASTPTGTPTSFPTATRSVAVAPSTARVTTAAPASASAPATNSTPAATSAPTPAAVPASPSH